MEKIWIDAIEFEDYGGWQTETQFVREMGQPYLIANQVPDVPVENARVSFSVKNDGYYRFFVRTKNWKYPEAPGRFTLKVDGKELQNVCGKMPVIYWYWEIADDMFLTSGKHILEVCDKTGWLSRFASVLITDDFDFTPSPELSVMLNQRAEIKGINTIPDEKGEFDYVVVGAGPGGVGAAISAARLGLKTALICDRPYVGGNASDEGTIGMDGASCHHTGFHETGIANEIKTTHESMDVRWQAAIEKLISEEPLIDVFENEKCIGAVCEDSCIKYIKCVNTLTLKESIFRSKLFADCSGDGWLGYYSGAKYRLGREAKHEFDEELAPEIPDTLTMSGCLCGTNREGQVSRGFYLGEKDEEIPFEAPDWAIKLPKGDALHRTPVSKNSTDWWLENSNDFDDLYDSEFARDEFVRLIIGYFDWLKNSYVNKKDYANKYLIHLALYNSKRENRRLAGDYMLTQNDFTEGKTFEDTVAYAGWKLDVHHPKGLFSGAEGVYYSDRVTPITPIPYRCLYSVNVKNLFMASRCASFSHISLGSARVENTLNTLGQAIGTAAYLCKKYNAMPRDIYKKHIKELQQTLVKYDQTIFGVKNEDSLDLAKTSLVSADSVNEKAGGFAENIINGFIRQIGNDCNAWISNPDDGLPQSITLTLKEAKEITEIHITADTDLVYPRVSYLEAPVYEATAKDMKVEILSGSDWKEIAVITGNYKRKHIIKFSPTFCQKVRITVLSASAGNYAKLNEVRIYS